MKQAPGRREQRKFERKPAELSVTVRTAGNEVEGGITLDSRDVSEGGAFLRSEFLFEVGETLHLEVHLPNGATVKATGKVVRVSRTHKDGQAPGMGIEFTRLAMNDRRAISEALARLSQQNQNPS